jgi:hypothetical protein
MSAPDLPTVLAAINLRSPDPVRTAHAAEVLARLLGWLAFDGNRCRREFKLWQSRGGDWWCELLEDHTQTACSHRADAFDALSHALQCALAAGEREAVEEHMGAEGAAQ